MTSMLVGIRAMFSFRSLALLGWIATGVRTTLALPMQITVNQRSSECLYDKLDEGELVTLSVFILSGPELKATMTMEGPLAPLDVDTGSELQKATNDFLENKPETKVDFSWVVDFEHLKPEVTDDDDDDDSLPNPNEGDASKLDEDEEGLDEAEKKRRRRERQREKFMLAKQKREKTRAMEQAKVREEGEPVQTSVVAPVAGWYRMCVQGTWYQVLAEIEMRKLSDLGGKDEDGNVITYEHKRMLEEDKLLEEDTASQEGIKDEDFQETRQKIKDLRRLLNEIQAMQQKERRRLTNHAETNEHSHSRMVLSSLFETLLFMAVTGYQVYTIRRWFSGAPVLPTMR